MLFGRQKSSSNYFTDTRIKIAERSSKFLSIKEANGDVMFG